MGLNNTFYHPRENIVIFVFIGAIEAYFFMNIASKYIPVTHDFVATTVLERIKNNIKKKSGFK